MPGEFFSPVPILGASTEKHPRGSTTKILNLVPIGVKGSGSAQAIAVEK
jgi:hypothetical protein